MNENCKQAVEDASINDRPFTIFGDRNLFSLEKTDKYAAQVCGKLNQEDEELYAQRKGLTDKTEIKKIDDLLSLNSRTLSAYIVAFVHRRPYSILE